MNRYTKIQVRDDYKDTTHYLPYPISRTKFLQTFSRKNVIKTFGSIPNNHYASSSTFGYNPGKKHVLRTLEDGGHWRGRLEFFDFDLILVKPSRLHVFNLDRFRKQIDEFDRIVFNGYEGLTLRERRREEYLFRLLCQEEHDTYIQQELERGVDLEVLRDIGYQV